MHGSVNESTPLEWKAHRLYGVTDESYTLVNPCPCAGTLPDYMHPYTKEQRLAILIAAYAREYTNSINDITNLLSKYVGSPKKFNFKPNQLSSNTELGKITCRFCCRCTCKLSFLQRCKDIFMMLCKILLILAIITIAFGKDIWALHFIANNVCEDLSNEYVRIVGVTTWIWIGPLVHLLTTIGSFILGCIVSICEPADNQDCIFFKFACVFILGEVFCFAWTIIGYLLYSEMDKTNDCADIVLAWSILQMTVCILPIGFCCVDIGFE